jgi:DNA-binding MarR family transcriptional regulator
MASQKTTTNTVTQTRATGTDDTANGTATDPGAGRPSGAAGAVWDALTANPGLTVAGIAAGAQVSRATVARVLTALERDGRAARTPGGRDGGKRQPDLWQAINPGTATATDAATATGAGHPASEAAPTGPSDDAARPDDAGTPTQPESTDTDGTPAAVTGTASTADGGTADGDAAGMDAAAVAEARDALVALRATISGALASLDAGESAGALGAIQAAYSASGRVRRLVRVAVNGRPRTSAGRPRAPRGEMRAKVEAHLAAHPGTEFTAHEIGKALGHSAGAVSNALDRLVEMDRAALVCERPRRFTAAPTA